MAVTADKVVVELELKDGQYLAKVRANESAFVRAQRNTANAAEDAERRIRASSGGIASSFRSLATSLAAGASAAAIMKMADGYTSLQNRLKATGLEGENLIKIENQLFDAANKNGIAIDSVAQLYQRASLAQKSLGASSDQIIALTDGVSAALRVQGVSATQASGPLLQLGQALGGGTVRAEELNSLLEGTPILLQAAANGSKRFNGDINALSAAIRGGKVSSKELFDALLAGLPAVQKQAENLPKTVGQAFEVLNNQLGRFVGQTDQSLSATARLAGGIEALANNLNTVVPALAVISGIFATRYVAGLAVAALAEDGFITKARQATAEAVNNERVKTAAVAAGTRARTAALTAESIALRAQVDTGRNATGQFISQAAAQRQLAQTNSALAASIGPATVATIKNTGAISAATAGAKAFGSGLTALAGGPIGVAILAVAALAAGIVYLGDKMEKTGVVYRSVEQANDALTKATNAYEEAANAAAVATGKEAVAARQAAAEKRALAAAARDSARAKLAEARATIVQINAEAQRMLNAERFNIRGDRPGSVRTVGRDQEFADANASAAASQKRIDEADAAISAADATIARSEALAAKAADTSSAPAALAATAASRVAVEATDTLAEDLARIQESLLTDAERAAKQLAEQAAIIARAVGDGTKPGLITAEQGARLNAGLAGQGLEGFQDPIGPISDIDPAIGQDIGKMIAEGAAAQVESWRGVARDFVDVLASDNIWEAAGHKFRDAAFDHLEDMLTNVFAALSKGGNGSGNIFAAIASSFGGNRASGGNVRAGMSYNVGEGGTERFVAPSNGYIIPNMKNANASPGMSGMVRIQIGEGEMFSARVTEIAGPLSVQAATTGVAYSQDQAINAQKRRGQSFV